MAASAIDLQPYASLDWVLESLVEGRVVNRISVPAAVAGNARIALQRMLET